MRFETYQISDHVYLEDVNDPSIVPSPGSLVMLRGWRSSLGIVISMQPKEQTYCVMWSCIPGLLSGAPEFDDMRRMRLV